MRLGTVRKTRITGAELSELPTAGSSSAFRFGGSISTKRIGCLARIGTVNFLVWTIVAVLVVILLATVFARRAVGGVDPTTLTFDPDLIGRVRALALAGQPIPAIKLLREQTPGLGLAAAKTMVDRMVKSGSRMVALLPAVRRPSRRSKGPSRQPTWRPAARRSRSRSNYRRDR